MTDAKNPYAFPGERYELNGHITYQEGMTLRDYFAGQALPSVMHLCAKDTMLPGESIEVSFARKAYDIAEAMLAARKGVA